MAKGTFGTPRPVGAVDEVRVSTLKIRLTKNGDYDFNVEVEEGDTTGGDFEVVETGNVRTNKNDLGASDQAALDNILKVALSLYINDRGYSGVVIS